MIYLLEKQRVYQNKKTSDRPEASQFLQIAGMTLFIHPAFRPSSPAQGVVKSSKELASSGFPPLSGQIRPKSGRLKCGNYFCAALLSGD